MDEHESHLKVFHQMVGEAASILYDPRQPITDIGKLLLDAWKLKKELADSVSNPAIDGICSAALDAGAVGVKLLGAGGGGFMLVMAAPEHHERIRERLWSLIDVSFKVGSAGSKIVVFEEDEKHARASDRLKERSLRSIEIH